MNKHFDVIIVGAGISGLACARKLIEQGAKVLILEARSRVGGRMFTKHEPYLDFPIEMGAEFIHGAPKSILKELETTGKSFYDVQDGHEYIAENKKEKRVEFWDRLDAIDKKYSADRKKDRSVLEFIESQRSIDSTSRQLFLGFIEGFQAADPAILSEKVMALAHKQDEGDLDHVHIFRITGGYDVLLRLFIQHIQKDPAALQLNTIVKKIRWSKNKVKVDCETSSTAHTSYQADKIVVTLPIGVLKSHPSSKGYIEWDPLPENFEQIMNGFQMGHVERLCFLFRSRFWEEHFKKPLSFMHCGPSMLFPTWWTQAPLRSPQLVAWQGGPKAFDLSRLPIEQRIEIALETLGKMLKVSKTYLHSQLLRWYAHDWTHDSFSLGAYSYIAVGGVASWKKLQEPFHETVYFAGEALASHAHRGTVHGALDSGLRAADHILTRKTYKK